MAEFKRIIITTKGQALMAKMIAGQGNIEFTKVSASETAYTDEQLEGLDSLSEVKQTTLVSKVIRTNNVAIQIEAAMTNSDLKIGYYMKTIGLYAIDPDEGEILYGVSNATVPGWMPPYNGLTVSGAFFKLVTTVGNAENVSLEVDPAAVATINDLKTVQGSVDTVQSGLNIIQTSLNEHELVNVSSETGIHGFRFFNDILQFYNAESGGWIDIETGGGSGGIAPSNVKNTKIKIGNSKLTLFWSDPGDTIVEGQILCTWKGTKLIQKVGSYPENVNDGTLVVDNQSLDAYATDGFEINNLTNGTTYYFALFPYSDKNAINMNEGNRLMGTPQPYKKMTVKVDLANSNPSTCITYADDAVGMTPGSVDWDSFFGHYPVLFKDGVEVGKLNRNNFAQFEDGTTADITSGNAGDVMIAFPRRGVKISTVGNILTISMTDDPDNAEFEYLAHTRGSTRKEKFYLGAYKGVNLSSKLRSISGKTPTASQTIGTFRTQAKANGNGYENSGFYQLVFRQVMYLLKYKNLDSQTAIGRGFVDGNSAATTTGNTNAKGMDFGETTGKLQMKLFGLEDFWGNIWEWIDGIVTDSSWNMLTATDNFNDAGTGYENQGKGASANVSGYLTKPQGTTKTGFLAKECGGSETTYFCDYAYLYSSCVASFGGNWSYASYAGAFHLHVSSTASNSSANVAARLMFL